MDKTFYKDVDEYFKTLNMLNLVKIHKNYSERIIVHTFNIYDEIRERIPDLTDEQVKLVVELIDEYR